MGANPREEILQLFKNNNSESFWQGKMIDAMHHLWEKKYEGCFKNFDSASGSVYLHIRVIQNIPNIVYKVHC